MTKSKWTALVSGASSGIGAVYADRLAKRGYDLILVARTRDRLASLAEKLQRETARAVEIIAADLNDKADLARIEERLRADDRIALLVNNAGTTCRLAIVMPADAMVDAALAGFDQGEVVTIPSLPEKAEWDTYEAARHAMSGRLSSAVPAARYGLRPRQQAGA